MVEAKNTVKRSILALAATALIACILPATSLGAFGLKEGSAKSVIAGEGTTAFTQAGGHPGALSNRFELKTVPSPVSGN